MGGRREGRRRARAGLLRRRGDPGFNHHDKGDTFPVDKTVKEPSERVRASCSRAASSIPTSSGWIERRWPSSRRSSSRASRRGDLSRPLALVETGVVKGRTVTSWPSLKTDIENAGGTWVDEEIVIDRGLFTSRNPDDRRLSARSSSRRWPRASTRAAQGCRGGPRPLAQEVLQAHRERRVALDADLPHQEGAHRALLSAHDAQEELLRDRDDAVGGGVVSLTRRRRRRRRPASSPLRRRRSGSGRQAAGPRGAVRGPAARPSKNSRALVAATARSPPPAQARARVGRR